MSDLSPIAAQRKAACTAFLREVREIHGSGPMTETSLDKIKGRLLDLAARHELFPDADFAMPDAQGRNHMLDDAANDGFGLYYTINLPGKEAAPHDHGIWCLNAGLAGRDEQRLWRRTDDGKKPGFATIEQISEVVVKEGTALSMLDHDIHSTMVVGAQPSRQLALYGYALNRFPEVAFFHPQFSSVRICAS
jgi:predicted metal-dependent enzyme (double-stranded beta helix superfamily)